MPVEPIATIKSPYKQKLGIPRQGSLAVATQGTIEFDRKIVGAGALDGLEGFSHLWLIFGFHKSQLTKKAKIAPPRLDGKKVGVFASRSPHRPNNIGLTLCRIIEVNQMDLWLRVGEIDLLDGTPIFDIKPYIAYADRPDEWTESWPSQLQKTKGEVVLTDSAQKDAVKLQIPLETIQVVKQSLAFDPRPNSQKNWKESFATTIDNWHFRFRVMDEHPHQRVEVFAIDFDQERSN